MLRERRIFYQGVIEPVADPSLFPFTFDWEFHNKPPVRAKPQSLRDRSIQVIDPSLFPFEWDFEFYNFPPKRKKPTAPPSHMFRFERAPGLNLDPIEPVLLKSYGLQNPVPYSKNLGGQYLINGNTASSDTVFTALRIYYMPLIIPYPVHMSEIGIVITERDDDTQTRLGIFAGERGRIGELIYSNIIQNNTASYRAVAANVQLPKGFFFVAFMTESSILGVRDGGLVSELTLLPHDSPDDTESNTHYFKDVTSFSDGFSTDPDVELDIGTTPTIWLKI